MMIFKVFSFIRSIMKGLKLVRSILAIMSLVSTFTGTKNVITMKTYNGVNVTITIGNDEINTIEDVQMIDVKDIKKVENNIDKEN